MKSVFTGLVIFLSVAFLGCREPKSYQETFPEYVEDFDASLPDGGEPAPAAACSEGAAYEFNNNFSPYFGGESSIEAEVVHFSSFYCSHCAEFAAYTAARWDNRPEYMENVRTYFHHATFAFRHRAAVAAYNQGATYFWKLHDYIYVKMLQGSGPSDSQIVSYAESLGLDMDRFETDIEADETYAFLKWDANQGFAADMENKGTPTVFVCGETVDYWPDVEDMIDEHL